MSPPEDVAEDPLYAFCADCERVFENEQLLARHCERTHTDD